MVDKTVSILLAVGAVMALGACGGKAVESGGGASGSGGTGTALTATQVIAASCEAIADLSCPVPDCANELEAVVAQQPGDCGEALINALACGNAKGWECEGTPPGEPIPNKYCGAELQAFFDCQGSAEECSGGTAIDGSECGVSCTGDNGFSASCRALDDGGLSCICSDGPHTGTEFILQTTCGDSWWDEAKAICS